MGGEGWRVLVISADEGTAETLLQAVGACVEGMTRRACSLEEARVLLAEPAHVEREFVVAASDLPDGNPVDLLAGVSPAVPLLVFLAEWDPVAARRALERGALDVLVPSDLRPTNLPRVLERARRARRTAEALREARAELREERDRLELVSRNLGVGLVTISRDYRTLWASSVVTDIFGDVVGRRCYEAYQRRNDICPDCGARKVFEDGQERVVHEQLHVDAAGNPVWFELVAAPLPGEGEKPQVVLELGIPVDARKRAEQALRESEERFRALSQEFQAILDAIPDPLFLISPDLTLLWANRGAARGLGRALEDLVGYRCYEIWHDRSAPCEPCPVQACLRSGRVEELCIPTPDGRIWDVRAVPVPDETGAVRGAVEVAHNVTDQRRAERDREALLEDLAAQNTLLEQFAQTISHDLKGPLVSIQGFATLLGRELDPGRDERAKAHAGRIGAAAERMKELLDALHALSLAGSTGERGPVSLSQVAGEALESYALQLAKRGVEVVVDPNLPIVRGDRVRLRQVFENLVANAVKFLGDQPSPRLDIGQRPSEQGPVFFVRDNGIGIEPDHRQRIFGLFEKLDPGAEGTGVGLAIVRRVVEAHGGRVWLESAGPGKGSTVCFSLRDEAPRTETAH